MLGQQACIHGFSLPPPVLWTSVSRRLTNFSHLNAIFFTIYDQYGLYDTTITTYNYLGSASVTQRYTALHSITQRYPIRYTALHSVTQRYTLSGTQRYTALHIVRYNYVITALHSVTHCQVQLLHHKHITLPKINYLGIFLGVIIPSTYLATLSKYSLVLDTLTTFHIN